MPNLYGSVALLGQIQFRLRTRHMLFTRSLSLSLSLFPLISSDVNNALSQIVLYHFYGIDSPLCGLSLSIALATDMKPTRKLRSKKYCRWSQHWNCCTPNSEGLKNAYERLRHISYPIDKTGSPFSVVCAEMSWSLERQHACKLFSFLRTCTALQLKVAATPEMRSRTLVFLVEHEED